MVQVQEVILAVVAEVILQHVWISYVVHATLGEMNGIVIVVQDAL